MPVEVCYQISLRGLPKRFQKLRQLRTPTNSFNNPLSLENLCRKACDKWTWIGLKRQNLSFNQIVLLIPLRPCMLRMADEIKEKIKESDRSYQELISMQQTLMVTDSPNRPGSSKVQVEDVVFIAAIVLLPEQRWLRSVVNICCRELKDKLAKLYVQCTQQDALINNLLCRARTVWNWYCHVLPLYVFLTLFFLYRFAVVYELFPVGLWSRQSRQKWLLNLPWISGKRKLRRRKNRKRKRNQLQRRRGRNL